MSIKIELTDEQNEAGQKAVETGYDAFKQKCEKDGLRADWASYVEGFNDGYAFAQESK